MDFYVIQQEDGRFLQRGYWYGRAIKSRLWYSHCGEIFHPLGAAKIVNENLAEDTDCPYKTELPKTTIRKLVPKEDGQFTMFQRGNMIYWTKGAADRADRGSDSEITKVQYDLV